MPPALLKPLLVLLGVACIYVGGFLHGQRHAGARWEDRLAEANLAAARQEAALKASQEATERSFKQIEVRYVSSQQELQRMARVNGDLVVRLRDAASRSRHLPAPTRDPSEPARPAEEQFDAAGAAGALAEFAARWAQVRDDEAARLAALQEAAAR